MKLMLIRHGEPDYASDSLTPRGHEEARLLAKALADVRIDAIYASPMGRAQLTATYTADLKRMPITTLDWLRELDGNYGPALWAWNLSGSEVFRGETPFTIENWHELAPYGAHMQPVAAEFWGHFDRFMASQGYVREGQGYRTTQERDERSLAFFFHAGATLTLLSHLLHVPLPVVYAQFACDPSSRTTLRFEAEGAFGVFRLECLNDTSHVSPPSPPG
jgi:probable phosphoglycerate mutase